MGNKMIGIRFLHTSICQWPIRALSSAVELEGGPPPPVEVTGGAGEASAGGAADIP